MDLYGRPYPCKRLELTGRDGNVDRVDAGAIGMLVGPNSVRRVGGVVRAAVPVPHHERVDRVVPVDRPNDLRAGRLKGLRVEVGGAADDAAESLEASGRSQRLVVGPYGLSVLHR